MIFRATVLSATFAGFVATSAMAEPDKIVDTFVDDHGDVIVVIESDNDYQVRDESGTVLENSGKHSTDRDTWRERHNYVRDTEPRSPDVERKSATPREQRRQEAPTHGRFEQ